MLSFLRKNAVRPSVTMIWLGLVAAMPTLAGPHEHGVVHMNIAIEGKRIQVDMTAPLESLLGYERAPRDGAEKAAAAKMLEQLRSAAAVIEFDSQGQCKADAPTISAPTLEGKADAKAAHSDLQAKYGFECTGAQNLQTAQINLFDVSRRISRVQVQVAGPQGQSQSTLRRNKRQLKLSK